MDTTTILIIAIVVGGVILSYVLKAILFSAYDKARNDRIRRKNAEKPPEKTNLSDLYDSQNKK